MSKKQKGGRYTPPQSTLPDPNMAAVAPTGEAFWPWYRRMHANPVRIDRQGRTTRLRHLVDV